MIPLPLLIGGGLALLAGAASLAADFFEGDQEELRQQMLREAALREHLQAERLRQQQRLERQRRANQLQLFLLTHRHTLTHDERARLEQQLADLRDQLQHLR